MTMREYANSLKVNIVEPDGAFSMVKWVFYKKEYYVNSKYKEEFQTMVDQCVEYYDQP